MKWLVGKFQREVARESEGINQLTSYNQAGNNEAIGDRSLNVNLVCWDQTEDLNTSPAVNMNLRGRTMGIHCRLMKYKASFSEFGIWGYV